MGVNVCRMELELGLLLHSFKGTIIFKLVQKECKNIFMGSVNSSWFNVEPSSNMLEVYMFQGFSIDFLTILTISRASMEALKGSI